MEEEIQIPSTVDEPNHILFWQWDVALPIGAGAIAGIMVNAMFWGLLAGLLLSRQYSRLRDNKPKGYFNHWLYSLGFMWEGKTTKSIVNANIDRFDS